MDKEVKKPVEILGAVSKEGTTMVKFVKKEKKYMVAEEEMQRYRPQ